MALWRYCYMRRGLVHLGPFLHPPPPQETPRPSVPPRLSHDNDENLVDPPAPMRTASIGQRVDTANWAVQVLQSPRILSEADANTLDAKGVPIGVQFRVANVGRQRASIGSSQFELEDVVGIRYSNIDWYKEGFLSFEQINPGLEQDLNRKGDSYLMFLEMSYSNMGIGI